MYRTCRSTACTRAQRRSPRSAPTLRASSGVRRCSRTSGLGDSDLEKYATELGLDADKFKTCRQDPATESKVNTDATAAREAGLTGTPAFFVNGILVSGARPIEDFTRWIDQELADKGGAPKSPPS